jgi:predicted ATPase/class 3 adenylate cyclase
MPESPTGVVTFLFTDIQGSTAHWERNPTGMSAALARHDALLCTTIMGHGGYIFKTVGDAFYTVFSTAPAAVLAALAAQRALAGADWGILDPLSVRMALHTGSAESRGDDYFGPALNRVARLLATGHGGQILLTRATQELVRAQLPPDAALRDLGQHRLKDLVQPEQVFQLIVPDLPADFPPLRTLDTHPNNLPGQPNPFIGREQEVAGALALLRRNQVRLVTFLGPGGTGKTRLSLQVAADLLDDFPDGVFFVPLAPIHDPALVVSTIGGVLGIRESSHQLLLDSLKTALREQQILLVLDNFEQIIAAAPLVTDLLQAAPRLKVLATSRELLHVYGEYAYAVPPLALPDLLHLPPLEQLTQYEAVRLFIERAQAVKPDFLVNKDTAPAIAEICTRLDGLPLAIELAAARVKLLSPQAMLTRLERRLSLLTGGARDLPARQQTLRGAISWSYDLLNGAEQALFRRLAVFVGGCTLAAIEAIGGEVAGADEVFDTLESLVAKSLLQQETSDPAMTEARFTMLETIREFAWDALAASGERDDLRERHAQYFLALARAAVPGLVGPEQALWLQRLEAEHDNLRAALGWALANRDTALSLGFGGALWRFWYVRNHFTEGRRWLTAALDLPAGPELQAARGLALNGAGNLAYNQGDYPAAEDLHRESLQVRSVLRDQQGVAASFNNLGLIARARSNYSSAGYLFAEALEINQTLNNQFWIAINLNNLGNVIHDQGNVTEARALQEQSLALFTGLGDAWGMAMSLCDLGNIVSDQGDYATATTLYEKGLALHRDLGDTRGIASTLNALGRVALRQGDYARATTLFQESLALSSEVGAKQGIAQALGSLGQAAYRQGDHPQAQAYFRRSLILRRELGGEWSIVRGLVAMAAVAEVAGQWERVTRLLGTIAAFIAASGVQLEPVYRAEFERGTAAARAALGPAAFAAAWAAGEALPLDRAVAYALEEP